MSARRIGAIALIVTAAVLCAPYVPAPGVNSADLVVLFAPVALVAVGFWPRRSKTPTGGDASPSSEASPSAVLPVGSSSHPLAEVDGDLAAHEARMEARARRLAGDS